MAVNPPGQSHASDNPRVKETAKPGHRRLNGLFRLPKKLSHSLLPSQKKKIGLSPGTLIYVGEPKKHKPTVTVTSYNDQTFRQQEVSGPADLRAGMNPGEITWIHVDGIHDMEILHSIGQQFQIHPLVMEDIANSSQRPKLEEFTEYLFLVFKWARQAENGSFHLLQTNIILGPDYVLTFQEEQGNVFSSISHRLQEKRGRIRNLKSDYLAYSLVDTLVDHYFTFIESVGENIDALQESMVTGIAREHLEQIYALKRELSLFRHSLWPLREVLGKLERLEGDFFLSATRPYLRDVYDHSIQILEALETQREMVAGLHDLYLSLVSNKLNEAMKVLTIFATIFIPLTFIAGVYGMNFRYMPELEWEWGYFAALGLMAAVGLGLLFYFKHKKWL